MENSLSKKILLFLFLFSPVFLFAQIKTITGNVKSDSGEPLVGVSIKANDANMGSSVGSITNLDGNYSIRVTSKTELTFSYVGFKSQSVVVGNQTVINITMVEETQMLDDFVVIGYGKVKKSDVTGAISSVKVKDMENTASAGIESALQGKVPGMLVTKSSGEPGATADIRLRGVGSFNSSGPLWIIDGVPQNPGAEFNMNDAESVEILRDGSAAAIYGAQAANGVILVTTKRGKKGESKISFNSYVGFNTPTKMPDVLNTRQLKELRLEDFRGQGKMTEAEMLAFPSQYSSSGGKNIMAYALDYDLTNVDYNWKDIIFDTGLTQNYDLSFSKGTDEYNYYASFNLYDEEGTYLDTRFRRYSFRLNSEIKLNKWATFGENMQILHVNKKQNSNSNYLVSYMRTVPFMMPYDSTNQPGGYGYFPKTNADGSPIIDPISGKETSIENMLAAYDGRNLLAYEETADNRAKDFKVNGNIYLRLQPIKDLTVTATMFGGFFTADSRQEAGQYQYAAESKLYSSMFQAVSRGYSLGGNLVANYNKTFNDIHSLALMAGMECEKSYSTGVNVSAKNMIGDIYRASLADAVNRQASDTYSNGAYLSYFGRVNYSLMDKYIFMAMIRRDGYDRFGPENRWGNFPSFSGAWRISNENFIKDNQAFSWLSDLKLRASWGLLGNMGGIQQFLYTANYITSNANYASGSTGTDGNQTSVTGLRLDKLPNHKIKWEEISTINLGLDVGAFNNSLQFTFDWYIKNTSNALFKSSLPAMAGLGTNLQDVFYTFNVGKIRNTGFDIEVNYRNRIGKELSYSVGANLGYVRNKVKNTDGSNAVLYSDRKVLGNQNVSVTQVGLPIGSFFAYDAIGVFQTQEEVDEYNKKAQENGYSYYQQTGTGPGDLIFRDVNNDGHITSDDIVHVGDPWPDFTYGFHVDLNYKWFDFNVLFQGVQGNDIFNNFRQVTHSLYNDYNTTTHALDRWTGPGSTNENFRSSTSDPNNNKSSVSTWYIEDGSYLRMKNIHIGFTFPQQWLSKCAISKLRIYASAQNLLTFTKYEGFDPEFSASQNTAFGIDTGNYPQYKTFLFGLQIDF